MFDFVCACFVRDLLCDGVWLVMCEFSCLCASLFDVCVVFRSQIMCGVVCLVVVFGLCLCALLCKCVCSVCDVLCDARWFVFVFCACGVFYVCFVCFFFSCVVVLLVFFFVVLCCLFAFKNFGKNTFFVWFVRKLLCDLVRSVFYSCVRVLNCLFDLNVFV